MPSLWMTDHGPLEFAALANDDRCDLLVVGGGIAGLSAAYEASRCGAEVVVIDRGEVAGGMTARTTAHLASELDDFYSELIRVAGEARAGLYHESQVAAVNRIEAVCRDEGIDADFARLPGYLVAAEPGHQSNLNEEYHACRKLGVAVEWSDVAPVPLPERTRALKFASQARFHPLKYCAGLARAIGTRGGRLHGNTAYVDHDERNERVRVRTAGPTIDAGAVLFATNSPVNDVVAVHTKQVPMRTYAIAARVPKGSVEDALVWDTLEAYHYVRLQPAGDGEDWLIVGGEDHRSGTADDMDERFARLEKWARGRFPQMGNIKYRWSGQVMEPVDFMPYSGRDGGSELVYLHSGDSGQGMTNGVAGALNFIALYRGDKAHFATLFDPARKPGTAVSLGEYVKGQGPVVANLAEYLAAGEVDSVDEIAPGEGAILRRGLAKHAVYRAEDGNIIERSAVCTHVGCIVHWNGFEKCWDCPCHGSQFRPDGSVINGPAIWPLAELQGNDRGNGASEPASSISSEAS